MHYLDYAATAPVLEEVLDAMLPYLRNRFGNPASVYAAGREAKTGLEEAREQVAAAIGAQPSEIVFTSGGTEADNLALKGVALRAPSGHIVTTAIEHHAVLHSAEWLERKGYRVTFVPADSRGMVDLDALEKTLSKETVLVSVMAANNETGIIQQLDEIQTLVKQNSRAVLHTDAVQALGKIPFDVSTASVDLASFSAHKIGGPKGVGALYVRRGVAIDAMQHGGGQERDVRSGTSNVAGIVGFAAAASAAIANLSGEGGRLRSLRDRLERDLLERIPGAAVNGLGGERLPGFLNMSFEGVEGESLLLMLDSAGIAASSGSACTSGSLDPSHVLLAMGIPPERAHGSLRFSLGVGSTEEDVDAVVDALPGIVERLRSIAPVSAAR